MITILLPLVLTILIESAVYHLYMKVTGTWSFEHLLHLCLVNAFTNPLLNVMIQLWHIHHIALILVMEAVVIYIEGVLLMKMGHGTYQECFKRVLIINMGSYLAGGLMYAYFI